MAEAHSAVAFSFTITHEGFNINYDREVLHLVWESGVRSWKKRFARFQNNVRNGMYPASWQSLGILLGVVFALFSMGVQIVQRPVYWIEPLIPGDSVLKGVSLWISCTIVGFGFWILKVLLLRYALKLLLMYKGWMYESRGGKGMSLKSQVWLALVKLLEGSNPLLYSYQASLPRLPLPSLKDTCKRYLHSVRPLMDDEKFQRMEVLTNEFRKDIGPKLQRYLWLKSWWATNYVSDWWEEYVYLRGRSSLMVNSNFYAMDALLVQPTTKQTARAANMIHAALLFRRLIDWQQLKPILVQNTVPLCSWQYERVFNTTRIPGIETDKIVHLNDSRHICVYHRGRYFKVPVYAKNRLLKPAEIQCQLDKILEDGSACEPEGAAYLGALTAADRVTWATARAKFFSKGLNYVSLSAIEKAAFCVVLDEEAYEFDPKDPSKLDYFGRSLLHGKGYNRWYDKSFNFIFGTNGRVGFNAEHSWADAPIMAHLWEFCLSYDFINLGYKEDGTVKGEVEEEPPAPIHLKWDLSQECLNLINSCVISAQALLQDVDLRLYMHDSYGKGFMKKCRVSPDAFIQMALQLAYYRDAGKFNLTYEASMTRLFREGRTETVRPVTMESSAWVKSMHDPDCEVEEKRMLLRRACSVHQRSYQDAMCGKGIDRHLFCLYVVSKYLEVDSPFLKEVLSEPWRLSTSQTPHGQTNLLDLRKYPKHISAGGGFGPVADDGYGVSYIIAGEGVVFFHVSSKRSSPETDSSRFVRNIQKALNDMRDLFEKSEVNNSHVANNTK